jgi:hypothetical protein
MIRDYEIREGLDQVAKNFHEYDSNPISWLGWMTYLLAKLENQARDINSVNQTRFLEMLSNLKDAIHNREQTGGW